jgi:hypothetical protein
MVIFASPAIVLYLYALSLEPSPAVQHPEQDAGGYELPANVQAAEELRHVIHDLLSRSQTLREQCARIAAARHVRVTIAAVAASTFDAQMRARSIARRYESGLLIVLVEVPVSPDLPELLAHELEHVTEFIEHVDLPALARDRRSGVTQRKLDGAYETERAEAAGRAAAAETDTGTDPVAAAIGHAVSKGARAAWRFVSATR